MQQKKTLIDTESDDKEYISLYLQRNFAPFYLNYRRVWELGDEGGLSKWNQGKFIELLESVSKVGVLLNNN